MMDLAGFVFVEAILLKLCLKIREEGFGDKMQNELKYWLIGSITGFQSSHIYGILTSLLQEQPVLSITSFMLDLFSMAVYNYSGWMLNTENRGIKIFDDEFLKSRGKLILETSEEESKQPARWEDGTRQDCDTLFYIDNKGEEEHGKEEDEKISESMNGAFMAAAHSIQSSEQGRKKLKMAQGEIQLSFPGLTF